MRKQNKCWMVPEPTTDYKDKFVCNSYWSLHCMIAPVKKISQVKLCLILELQYYEVYCRYVDHRIISNSFHENWPINWPDFAVSPARLGWPACSRHWQASNAAFAHAPVCSMLWTELHKTAGTHYVDGMMLLVKAAKMAGVMEPL